MSRQARLVDAEVERPLREAAVFVVVTFAIAAVVYLPLLAAARGWIGVSLPAGLSVFGVLSPGIAVLVLRANDGGRDAVRTSLSGLTAWRFGRTWWAVTLALPPLFFVVTDAVYVGLGGEFSPEPVRRLVEAGPAAAAIILVTMVLAFGEEIGWRGYLLPRLQARMGALAASLLLGAIWFAWHVPLFLQAGTEAWPIPLRGVFIVGGAVMYTWLFNNTGGSVLAVTLLHAGFNIWGRLLGAHPLVTGDVVSGYVLSAGNVLLAVLLVVVFGARSLTDTGRLSIR